MNTAHLHLIITHLPIMGVLSGILVLLYAIARRSAEVKIAAYGLFVVSALGAGIAYLTGEGAEETVENLPGVLESLIERHEESALWALIAMIVLGVAALAAIFWASGTRLFSNAVLVLAVVSFFLIARTGYLGGQIRHTEIRDAAALQPSGNDAGDTGTGKGGEKDDDD